MGNLMKNPLLAGMAGAVLTLALFKAVPALDVTRFVPTIGRAA